MKKTTIHLSLPAGSQPPELHTQVSPETLLYLATRASAAGASKTQIAAMSLAASAAASGPAGADLTIDFRFLLPGAALAEAIAALREQTAAISSARIALTSTRVPSSPAARAERADLLDALAKALASAAATHATLLAAAGLSPAGLTAEVVTRALAEPAPAAPTLPPGVTAADVESLLRNNLQKVAALSIWVACALAAAAIGREFTIPRPATPPPAPPPTPPPADGSAVQKLVTATPEGEK